MSLASNARLAAAVLEEYPSCIGENCDVPAAWRASAINPTREFMLQNIVALAFGRDVIEVIVDDSFIGPFGSADAGVPACVVLTPAGVLAESWTCCIAAFSSGCSS